MNISNNISPIYSIYKINVFIIYNNYSLFFSLIIQFYNYIGIYYNYIGIYYI